MTSRIAGFVRRDLLRALRLTFLLALLLVSVATLSQVVIRHFPTATVACTAVVMTAVLTLRVVEYRRARPVGAGIDAVELLGLAAVLAQVREIEVLLGPLFFLLLCRAAMSSLRRLLPMVAGYIGVWLAVAAVFPEIRVLIGALVSMPVLALLVYTMRMLMLRLQDQQQRQNALLNAVLSRLPFPVVVTDHGGEVVLTNPAATTLTGAATLTGLDARDADGAAVDLRALAAAASASGAGFAGLEVRLPGAGDVAGHVLVEAVPMESGVVVALLDVTAQRLYEEQLHHIAYHDMLTGLPNRALLWQHLAAVQHGGRPYAILLVDLDDFKAVNDTLGHQAGDELLRQVAQRFRHVAGGAATVARLGGDEFAVLLRDVTPGDAETVAEAVRSCFGWPFPVGAEPLRAGGTVGCAVAAPGQSPDEVLNAADAAMYRSKPRARTRSRAAHPAGR